MKVRNRPTCSRSRRIRFPPAAKLFGLDDRPPRCRRTGGEVEPTFEAPNRCHRKLYFRTAPSQNCATTENRQIHVIQLANPSRLSGSTFGLHAVHLTYRRARDWSACQYGTPSELCLEYGQRPADIGGRRDAQPPLPNSVPVAVSTPSNQRRRLSPDRRPGRLYLSKTELGEQVGACASEPRTFNLGAVGSNPTGLTKGAMGFRPPPVSGP
jgi:hypothetical protein